MVLRKSLNPCFGSQGDVTEESAQFDLDVALFQLADAIDAVLAVADVDGCLLGALGVLHPEVAAAGVDHLAVEHDEPGALADVVQAHHCLLVLGHQLFDSEVAHHCAGRLHRVLQGWVGLHVFFDLRQSRAYILSYGFTPWEEYVERDLFGFGFYFSHGFFQGC